MTNAADYLALPNVVAVGGSWVAPQEAIAAGDFARPKTITLPVEALEQFAGQYTLNEKPDSPPATIARDGGHLTISFPFRPQRLELEPISESEFDMPYTDGRFQFRKDGSGRVTGVLFRIGDGQRDMKKVAP